MRKYAILEHMRQLPYEEYRKAMNELPQFLGVSKNTFRKWLYLRKTDKAEVRLSYLKKIADFFGLGINQIV